MPCARAVVADAAANLAAVAKTPVALAVALAAVVATLVAANPAAVARKQQRRLTSIKYQVPCERVRKGPFFVPGPPSVPPSHKKWHLLDNRVTFRSPW